MIFNRHCWSSGLMRWAQLRRRRKNFHEFPSEKKHTWEKLFLFGGRQGMEMWWCIIKVLEYRRMIWTKKWNLGMRNAIKFVLFYETYYHYIESWTLTTANWASNVQPIEMLDLLKVHRIADKLGRLLEAGMPARVGNSLASCLLACL